MRYILVHDQNIIKFKDNYSRVVRKFIDLYGSKDLMRCDSLEALNMLLETWKVDKYDKDKRNSDDSLSEDSLLGEEKKIDQSETEIKAKKKHQQLEWEKDLYILEFMKQI